MMSVLGNIVLFLFSTLHPLPSRANDNDLLYFDKSKPNLETFLDPTDFERAKYVRFFQRDQSIRVGAPVSEAVLYRRDRFEGDIVGVHPLTFKGVGVRNVLRSAVRNRWQTWPSRKIPYAISTQYSSFSRSRIAAALEEYSRRTCVEFVPRTNELDYVFVAPDDGCYSMIGKTGGRQTVSLGSGCVNFGIIIHELMHSLGFFHEQSRPDRDDYVTVNWTNVADDMKDQFIKYSYGMINTMGFIYDYGSVMHYSARAFTKNGEPTIVPRAENVRIGQREGFSEMDATKVNALYSCDSTGGGHPSSIDIVHPVIPVPSVTLPPIDTSTEQILATRQIEIRHCADEMDDCPYRRNLGYCQTIRHWMERYCKLTCGFCDSGAINEPSINSGPVGSSCVDTNAFCESWARAGFCHGENFGDYMRRNCKKACNVC